MMTKMLLALKSEHFFQRKVKHIYLNFPYYDENNLEVGMEYVAFLVWERIYTS